MVILAADTSTPVNTVCLSRSGQILAETVVLSGRKHSERLLETVDWVLSEGGMGLGQVDTLAVSVGPGSFTGLRVGIATWKGLALAQGLPLAGVPTLDAMTGLGVFTEGVVCPLLDARMHEVFGAVYAYRGGIRTKLTPDRVCSIDDFLNDVPDTAVFLGDGATLYADAIRKRFPQAFFAPGHCAVPRASAVAWEAFQRLEEGASTDAAAVVPIYLRKSQPEEKKERAALS
ncbi:MAG: tRNA (adenosine(37)-N6)-threonylcarbamoyltransferase complex dimerization subunit type 1 TsaB [FCB group bacterium]|jgi:tRNA threonylcarbamoyladenosine biosynthesis protein TsaB|nr:tRNA (adenosine(37)-N6)-threonylcarbamoyltransferase complex dimerization subunit type 1 TsaB [FCB group bacterium]